MEQIRNKECELCKLSTSCSTPCIVGVGPQKAKLMLVAEAPSINDDKEGTVLNAYKDKLLKYVLKDCMGVDPSEVYLTYLVKCAPQHGFKADEEQAKICYDNYLTKEIQIVAPECIVVMGELAMNTVLGITGITKQRGELNYLTSSEFVIPVIPTYLPGYAVQKPNLTEQFAKDIDKAYLISEGAKAIGKQVPYTLISTEAEMNVVCDYIIEIGHVCFDFETTNLGVYNSVEFKPTLLSISFQAGHAYALPLYHFQNELPEIRITNIFGIFNTRILQNPQVDKINHNLKYELHVLTYWGITDIRGRLQDTMLQHHLLDEDRKHGLKEIVDTNFPEYAGYSNAIKKYKWEAVPLDLLCSYGVTDTDRTLVISIQQENELLADPQLYNYYRNLTMPALKALFYAERDGFAVDVAYLEQSIDDVAVLIEQQIEKLRNFRKVKSFEAWKKEDNLNNAIAEQERKLVQATKDGSKAKLTNANKKLAELKAGQYEVYEPINFASTKQLGELLYSANGFDFEMPYSKKHRGPKEVTDRPALMGLKDKSGFVDALLVLRSINLMRSTYMVGLYELLDKKNRIHTSFLIHGTESGRLSSREPNLQNIPRGSKLGDDITKDVVSRIKKMFITDPEYYLVQVDYSQAELRIAAEFANETKMLAVYENDGDLHITTAMSVNKLSHDQWGNLSKEEAKDKRSQAKAGNFGLIYDISVDGFITYAKDTYGVVFTKPEAEKYVQGFFNTYPNLKPWHKDSILTAKQQGYIRTLLGRKRRTPEIHNSDSYIRSMDERIAINSPVQGTAGEFTILALCLLSNRLPIDVRLVNTVHDSILYLVPKAKLVESCRIIKNTCENLPIEKYFGRKLKKVKMKVDLEYSATSWGELKPIDFEL